MRHQFKDDQLSACRPRSSFTEPSALSFRKFLVPLQLLHYCILAKMPLNLFSLFCYEWLDGKMWSEFTRIHETFSKIRFAEDYFLLIIQNLIIQLILPIYRVSRKNVLIEQNHNQKGWGLSAKLGNHSAIWGKLGTALQAYALNPCTKFPPNPTSRKVNT